MKTSKMQNDNTAIKCVNEYNPPICYWVTIG